MRVSCKLAFGRFVFGSFVVGLGILLCLGSTAASSPSSVASQSLPFLPNLFRSASILAIIQPVFSPHANTWEYAGGSQSPGRLDFVLRGSATIVGFATSGGLYDGVEKGF